MFNHACLLMAQRDARAAELAASIHKRGKTVDEIVLSPTDVDALAMAIERATPDQVAQWVVELFNVSEGDYFDDEDDADDFDDAFD